MAASEIGLGTRLFGEVMDAGTCREVLDVYEDAGGNLLDTAVTYGDGRSEEVLGRLLAGRRRDRFVVSTKFGLRRNREDANAAGASRRNLRRSLDESLRRLGTDHVDVLWLHAWYPGLAALELLRAARDEIARGRVLSLGMSNAPAWWVSRAHTLAESRGWDPICGIQVEYSLRRREADEDFLPMAAELGMAVVAWSPLDRGRLLRAPGVAPPGGAREREERIRTTLESVAGVLGVPPVAVAVGWVISRGAIPLVGARTAAQLREAILGAGDPLPAEQRRALDGASATDPAGLPALLRAVRTRIDPGLPVDPRHVPGASAAARHGPTADDTEVKW